MPSKNSLSADVPSCGPSRSVEVTVAEGVRDQLKQAILKSREPRFTIEEVEIHFTKMPSRYWARIDATTLVWHLATLQQFFASLISDHGGTRPVVTWRHHPTRGHTEVVIATWDRQGLLTKIAGAFAEVDLNIVRAEVYTRSDHVALDVFHVCTADGGAVQDEDALKLMHEILSACLAAHRELALIASHGKAFSDTLDPLIATEPIAQPRVALDNDREDEYTILEVQATDRIGLLFTIFQVLSAASISVTQAIISTEARHAVDVFYLVDHGGKKIRDASKLDEIMVSLLSVLR